MTGRTSRAHINISDLCTWWETLRLPRHFRVFDHKDLKDNATVNVTVGISTATNSSCNVSRTNIIKRSVQNTFEQLSM